MCKKGLSFLLFLGIFCGVGLSQESAGGKSVPTYASPKTKDVIGRMLEAHGGLERWRQAKTIKYTNVMFLPIIDIQDGMSEWDRWGCSDETFELTSRRGYHDLPFEKAQIASDGKKVWSIGIQGGNPPKVRYQGVFYFVNLPWLTQDPGVHLGEPGMAKLPGDDKDYITIKVTFVEGVGNTAEDYHLLYIDPENYLLKATEYIVTYAALLDMLGLPPEMTSFGPMLRVFDDYVTVGGLTVPSRYRTHDPQGKTMFGVHLLTRVEFGVPFDESRMRMTAGAVIDNSNGKQRASSK